MTLEGAKLGDEIQQEGAEETKSTPNTKARPPRRRRNPNPDPEPKRQKSRNDSDEQGRKETFVRPPFFRFPEENAGSVEQEGEAEEWFDSKEQYMLNVINRYGSYVSDRKGRAQYAEYAGGDGDGDGDGDGEGDGDGGAGRSACKFGGVMHVNTGFWGPNVYEGCRPAREGDMVSLKQCTYNSGTFFECPMP